MSQLKLQDVLDEAEISLELLEQPCSEERLLELANHCDPWNIVGLHLKLSETVINDIDRDYRTTEEKRIKLMQKWKEGFAFKATYKVFVKALMSCGRADPALKVCRLLKGRIVAYLIGD